MLPRSALRIVGRFMFIIGVLQLFVGCSQHREAPSADSDALRILDRWPDRETAHRQIELLGEGGWNSVISVALDSKESSIRRQRAMGLLAIYQHERGSNALIRVLDTDPPALRCVAIRSLMERKDKEAVPALIEKLGDQAICMQQTRTDPWRQIDVYVSDEVVRALESITGFSFEKSTDLWVVGHRATAPWKKWWVSQKR